MARNITGWKKLQDIKAKALAGLEPMIEDFSIRAYQTIATWNSFDGEYYNYKDAEEIASTVRRLIESVHESENLLDAYSSTGGLKVSYNYHQGNAEAKLEIDLDFSYYGASVRIKKDA